MTASTLITCPHCFAPLGKGRTCPSCKKRADRPSPRPARTLAPGTRLKNRYVLGDVIGEGGFGITYFAFDEMKKARVAVKEYFPSSFAVRDGNAVTVPENRRARLSSGRKRFTDEAKNMAAIKGLSGIPSALDYFGENGTAYIVMEYISGETLKNLVSRKGRLGERDALRLLFPVFASLALVHDAGIVHRDVSADNIIITTDGSAKLIDFGASVASPAQSGSQLKRGYAPPEQYEKGAEVDVRADVYASAATLYYCLTGCLPPDAADRIKADRLSFPARMSAGIGSALARALATDKNARCPDMRTFMRELAEVYGENP